MDRHNTDTQKPNGECGHCPVVSVACPKDARQAVHLWGWDFVVVLSWHVVKLAIQASLSCWWYLVLCAGAVAGVYCSLGFSYAVVAVLVAISIPLLNIIGAHLRFVLWKYFELWQAMSVGKWDSSICYWVAHCHCKECNGKVVGVVGAIRNNEEKVELVRMVVSPSMRRQGVGLMLCDKVLEFGKANGYKEIVLSTLSSFTGAVNLYPRAGYKVLFHMPYPYLFIPLHSTVVFFGRECNVS